MNPGNKDRLLAIEEGRKTYSGRECKRCNTNVKYVNGSVCVECVKRSTAARDPSIGARYQSSDHGKSRTKNRKQGLLVSTEFDVAAYKEKEKAKYKANPSSWVKHNLKQYGMTLEEYNILRESQLYQCAICETHEDNLQKSLSVDHCHKSGKVRELLCNKCNTALGFINDDPHIAEKLLAYIIKYKDL